MEKKQIVVDCNQELLNESLTRILPQNGYEIHRDFTTTSRPDVAIFTGASYNCKQRRQRVCEISYAELLEQSVFFETCIQRGISKVIFLAPSSIYAKNLQVPIKEQSLGFGELEDFDEAYSSVKITGIKMGQAYGKRFNTKFISLIYSNIYGINDDYTIDTGHVLPSIIGQISKAKKENHPAVCLMGSGRAMRDFLFVDDLTSAILSVIDKVNESQIINVGTGTDVSIQTLVSMLSNVLGFRGRVIFNINSGSDGKIRILMNNYKLKKLNWSPKYNLKTYLDIMCGNYSKKV